MSKIHDLKNKDLGEMNEEKYTPDKHYKQVICALSILRQGSGEPFWCEQEKCSLWDSYRKCCLLSSLAIDYLVKSYKSGKKKKWDEKGI